MRRSARTVDFLELASFLESSLAFGIGNNAVLNSIYSRVDNVLQARDQRTFRKIDAQTW